MYYQEELNRATFRTINYIEDKDVNYNILSFSDLSVIMLIFALETRIYNYLQNIIHFKNKENLFTPNRISHKEVFANIEEDLNDIYIEPDAIDVLSRFKINKYIRSKFLGSYSSSEQIIEVFSENIENSCIKKYNCHNYDISCAQLYNFTYIEVICHEFIHSMQNYYILHSKLYNNSFIYNAIKAFDDYVSDFDEKKATNLYHKYYNLLIKEREARVFGVSLANQILTDKVDFDINLYSNYLILKALLKGYRNDRSPIEIIGKRFNFNYRNFLYDTHHFDNYTRLLYGLPVDEYIVEEAIQVVDDYKHSREFIKYLKR